MAQTFLAINRVEVLTRNCSSCGEAFASTPIGEKALVAAIPGVHPYFFCAGCGDNIMSRVQSEEARKHYVWDWAVPLIGEPVSTS